MLAKRLTPILNVSNIVETFDWFERLGWQKAWEWGTPPDRGVLPPHGCRNFIHVSKEAPKHHMAMRRFDPRGPQRGPQIRINQRIRVPEVRVIAESGEMLGVMPTNDGMLFAFGQRYFIEGVASQGRKG